MKAVYFANFGGGQQIDGQVAKSKNIKELLSKVYFGSIKFYECFGFMKTPFRSVWRVISLAASSDIVYVSLGKKGIWLFSLIFFVFRFLERRKTYYFVVGGWLPELYVNSYFVRRFVGNCEKVYVETDEMKNKLVCSGADNDLIEVFENFRVTSFYPNVSGRDTQERRSFRFVYYSRVSESKGVFLAIQAINDVARYTCENVYMDIYGPIVDNINVNELNTDYTRYCGVLTSDNDECYKRLQNYDALIFPTSYEGEGFPGAIVDAFISGIPVIASDWKYNKHIIRERFNGVLFYPIDVFQLSNSLKSYMALPWCDSEKRRLISVDSKRFRMENFISTIESHCSK